ncbi:MAG: hypothetical protein V1703_04820 [Candidatus Altiarchaeota archaeon]
MKHAEKSKSQRKIAVAAVLVLISALLLWYSFIKPSVVLSDWKISNDGEYYASTRIPHYSYHTIVPYIYFKGDLIAPEGLDEYHMDVSVDGCIQELKVNNRSVYLNDACMASIPYDQRSIEIGRQLKPGRNGVEVKVVFDGGTTRFEIFEKAKYNLIRLSLVVVLLSMALILLGFGQRGVFALLLLSLVFIHVFSSSFRVSWGYSALEAFPWYVNLLLVLLSLLLLTPASYDKIVDELAGVWRRFKPKITAQARQPKPKHDLPETVKIELDSIRRYLTYSLMSLFSFIILWAFRTKNSMGDQGFVGRIAMDKVHLFFATSPLTAWTLSFAYKLLKSLGFSYSSYDASALVACFVGALSVPALWVICRELFDSRGKSIMLFSIVASSYFMQLFFGYIEFYPMLLAAMIYYTLAGIYYLKDKVSIVYPSVAFAVMFCIHLSSGYLGLSLLMLYFYKVYEGREKVIGGFLKMSAINLVIISLFLGNVIFVNKECGTGFVKCVKGYVSALKGSDPGFFRTDILTMNFAQEILTEYVYISPAAVVLLFFILLFYTRGFLSRDRFYLFMLLSTLGFALYTVTHVTGTGLPNDWDVLAPIGLPLTMLAGYVLINSVKDRTLLGYCVVSMVSVTLLIHTMPTLLNSAELEHVLSNPLKALSEVVDYIRQLSFELQVKVEPEKFPMEIIDSVDVGNNESEMAHIYIIKDEVKHGVRSAGYPGGEPIDDDYRSFRDQESFIVVSQPGTDITIVKRIHCPSGQATRVYLHGGYIGTMEANCREANDSWKNIELKIPGSAIKGDKIGLMFVPDNKEDVESYYYWFYIRNG